MPGNIDLIARAYLDLTSLEADAQKAGVTCKVSGYISDFHAIYEVKAGSTLARKCEFVVGMLLTGIIPFLIFNCFKSFHEYFFGKSKEVQVLELCITGAYSDQWQKKSSNRVEIAAAAQAIFQGLNIKDQQLIEMWQKSDAGRHYRAYEPYDILGYRRRDHAEDDLYKLQVIAQQQDSQKLGIENQSQGPMLDDYVYLTGPICSSDKVPHAVGFTLYCTKVDSYKPNRRPLTHELIVYQNQDGAYYLKDKPQETYNTLQALVDAAGKDSSRYLPPNVRLSNII